MPAAYLSGGCVFAAFGPVVRIFAPDALRFDKALREIDFTPALQPALAQRTEQGEGSPKS